MYIYKVYTLFMHVFFLKCILFLCIYIYKVYTVFMHAHLYCGSLTEWLQLFGEPVNCGSRPGAPRQ